MAQFLVYGTYEDETGTTTSGFYWVTEPDPDPTTDPVEVVIQSNNGDPVPVDGANILGYYEEGAKQYELTSLNVTYVPDVGAPVPDVMTYDGTSVDVDTTSGTESGGDATTPFDDFEQYYDDDNTPQYDASGCEGGLGIRG